MVDYRNIILNRLLERNKLDSFISVNIISDYEEILNRLVHTQKLLEDSKFENDRLRSSNISPNDQISSRKMYEMQEELTNAVKEKSGLNIQILELKLECNSKDKDVQELRLSMNGLKDQIKKLEELVKTSSDSIKKLEDIKRTLTDEISANLMAYQALDKKYKELQDGNQALKDTVKKLQQDLSEKMNDEYDKKYKAQQEVIQKSLQEAASSYVNVDVQMRGPSMFVKSVPDKVKQTLDAHEGEMGCVRFSPTGRFLATSGADRKIKIWSHNYGMCEYKCTLTGCNGSVISVDYDQNESLILGTSTLDSSCRIWSLNDFRMRISLTGHSNKVVAGRFLADGLHVITGSTDRTLKLWDTMTRTCVKTMLTMSACHDVVVCSALGLMISGHFDKKIRMWDHRGELNTDQVVLTGRITGLDISRDQNTLLACQKDDCLQAIDLRMNQFVQNYTAPQFKPGMDLVKPCFSPDGQYVAAGSQDGSIFVWNSRSGKIEKVLKDQGSNTVCVHWCPTANVIASCERNKKVFIWGE